MSSRTLTYLAIVLLIIAGGVWYYTGEGTPPSMENGEQTQEAQASDTFAGVTVNPISHASVVFEWGGDVLYADPVGGADAYADMPAPDVIVITHTHGDHLDTDTLSAIVTDETTLFVPQLVRNQLPEALTAQTNVLDNGENMDVGGFGITAIEMYNVPASPDANHVRGNGNGYVIERDGTRVYVAGDTGATQEMRNLQSIDLAFIPMNLPYTMSVEEAAEGVLAFAPRRVYPYHYRNQDDTLSDVEQFQQLVNAEDDDIDVMLLDWYPDRE